MGRFRIQQFLKVIILAAFALFFTKLHASGDITKYINPKYEMMSYMAIWIFSFFFTIQIFRIWVDNGDHHTNCQHDCGHDHSHSAPLPRKWVSYSIILFPLVTGFALSPSVLDSSIAAKKGTILPQSNNSYSNLWGESVSESDSIDIQEDQEAMPNDNFLSKVELDKKIKNLDNSELIEMEEDIFSVYYERIMSNPKEFQGRKIRISGFVYREDGMELNQLVISRFLITHCIADASFIGLLTQFEQASNFKEDTWLVIEGTLDITTYNGVELPILKATEWKVMDEPAQPYVYPVLTKLTD